MKRSRAAAATVALLATTLVVGSVAWGCTALSAISSISPGAAPPGATVAVSGRGFNPGPVEIHLQKSPTAAGVVIGNAEASQAGSFTVPVQVPDVAEGMYYIRVTQSASLNPADPSRNPWGDFEVTAPAAADDTTETDEPQRVDGPAPQPAPVQPPATSSEPPAASGSGGSTIGSSSQSSRNTTSAVRTPGAGTSNSSPAAVPVPQNVVTEPGESAAVPAPVPGLHEVPRVAPATVHDDLFSGFASTSARTPGSHSLVTEPPARGSASPLVFGLGLLTLGLMALSLAGVGALRRRRVATPQPQGPPYFMSDKNEEIR